MSERTIYRYAVPVDDLWHDLPLTGPIVHVATRAADEVEVWAWHTTGTAVTRRVRVFGTGHPVPAAARHLGTAIVPTGALMPWSLVWHLMEVDTDG